MRFIFISILLLSKKNREKGYRLLSTRNRLSSEFATESEIKSIQSTLGLCNYLLLNQLRQC